MPIDPSALGAVVFDYGNTLAPFTPDQLAAYGRSLGRTMTELLGPFDEDAYAEFRAQSRLRPFQGDPPTYRENPMRDITAEMVRLLYGRDPSIEEMEILLQARFDSFVQVMEGSAETGALLARLSSRYPLGLLSNYPDGPAIRASLDKLGWTPYFKSIVVSGEVGYCKPHPVPFALSLQALECSSHEVLFVGDSWHADVQGAKRVGMQMVQVRQWEPPEPWQPHPDDREPDAVIASVLELEPLLNS